MTLIAATDKGLPVLSIKLNRLYGDLGVAFACEYVAFFVAPIK
jgi:hypothetical protein